jgi:hypothetical protein
MTNWINPSKELPAETYKGTPVIVRLTPVEPERMYGDVVYSVYYGGKFHWNFRKGSIQNVIEWVHLPK